MSSSDTEVIDRISQMSKMEPCCSVALHKNGTQMIPPGLHNRKTTGQWFCTVNDPKGNVWIEDMGPSAVEAVRVVWVEFMRIRGLYGMEPKWRP